MALQDGRGQENVDLKKNEFKKTIRKSFWPVQRPAWPIVALFALLLRMWSFEPKPQNFLFYKLKKNLNFKVKHEKQNNAM